MSAGGQAPKLLGPQGIILFLPRLQVFSCVSVCLPDVGSRSCGGNLPQWQGPHRCVTVPATLLGLAFAEAHTGPWRTG